VALVVSASINWGKRCPHFLAETRPPFFATSLRANGKNGHARRRGKKNTFFSRPHLSSSGHRRRNLTVSPLSPARRVTTRRGKRETVRGDARVDVRVFFLLGSGPSREKSRVSRKKPPFAAAVAGESSSAERVVFRGGASLELFAPCVRPRARSRERRLRRRNTPAQKIVLEQVFFTNRSLEASWVNSVRSSPRRVVVSAPLFSDPRASRRKRENRRVRERRVRAPPPMDPWRGRSRRREGGLAAVSASRARAAASAVRSEVNSCYPIVRKPAKALVGLGRHALSSHRASEAAAAAPRREKRTRRASRSGAAASPVAGGGATRAPHVPHASRVGIRGDATIAGRSRRTRGAPRGGARAIL
jgi:hypothetical protein